MTAINGTKEFGRERVIVLASLLMLAALSWLYLWMEARSMASMPMPSMPMPSMPMPSTSMTPMQMGAGAVMEPASMPAMSMPALSVKSLAVTFLMWAVMMVGMMLPSAAPAILLYGSMVKKGRAANSALPAAWVFTAGYVAVWCIFSVAATAMQAAFEMQHLLAGPIMTATSVWLSGALFMVAGIYQWLPIKGACLEKCRSPLQFLLFRWRPGGIGAFKMGVEHGFFCVGCCWALMLLLFAAGVMNLLWVALIAGFVLIEKLAPGGRLIGRVSGVAMVAIGAGIILVNV